MAGEFINKFDSLLVLTIAFIGGVCIELIGYIFVYRHDDFKELHNEIWALRRQLDAAKVTGNAKFEGNYKKEKVTLDNLERDMKKKNSLMGSKRFKLNIFTGLLCMVLMPTLFSLFEGTPVAVLPFTCPWPFYIMTHSGIPGDNMSECSATFLCMLTLFLTRQNIQRIMGYASPASKQGSLFPSLEKEKL